MDTQPGTSKAAPHAGKELLAAVDFQEPQSPSPPEARILVSNDQPLPLPVDPPMTNLDKIVLVIVVSGIIAFAWFQTTQCVAAYANPSTQTNVLNVTRTFPGIMLCPFSYQQIPSFTEFCPKWSPQASLAFDFSIANATNGCSYSALSLLNTNVDPASQSQRSPSKCSLNSPPIDRPDLEFRAYVPPCTISFEKQVTVKNFAKPVSFCNPAGKCSSCNSWTPPNVQCTVFDPSSFDQAIRIIPSLNPICNPMKEVYANSVDALYVIFDQFGSKNVFSYSGLIPQPSAPPSPVYPFMPNPFVRAPSSLSISPYDLQTQGSVIGSQYYNVNMSLFGGVVAVLYDASKGIPTALDFDGARFKTMSSSILGSTVGLSTNCRGTGVITEFTCVQYKAPATSCVVTSQVDESFTNAILQQKTNSTLQTVSCQPSQVDQSSQAGNYNDVRFGLSVSFSSSVSAITSPTISLTILTTVSIIVSTAATLWGSQQFIKEGILLVIAKVRNLGKAQRR